MEQQIQKKFKTILENERTYINGELNKIATQSKTDPNEWLTKFSTSDNDTTHESLEIKADEVEEYGNEVALTGRLSKKLADVNLALDKIAKETFGKCENCGKLIPPARLEAFPTARFCTACASE